MGFDREKAIFGASPHNFIRSVKRAEVNLSDLANKVIRIQGFAKGDISFLGIWVEKFSNF